MLEAIAIVVAALIAVTVPSKQPVQQETPAIHVTVVAPTPKPGPTPDDHQDIIENALQKHPEWSDQYKEDCKTNWVACLFD